MRVGKSEGVRVKMENKRENRRTRGRKREVLCGDGRKKERERS